MYRNISASMDSHTHRTSLPKTNAKWTRNYIETKPTKKNNWPTFRPGDLKCILMLYKNWLGEHDDRDGCSEQEMVNGYYFVIVGTTWKRRCQNWKRNYIINISIRICIDAIASDDRIKGVRSKRSNKETKKPNKCIVKMNVNKINKKTLQVYVFCCCSSSHELKLEFPVDSLEMWRECAPTHTQSNGKHQYPCVCYLRILCAILYLNSITFGCGKIRLK